MRMVFEIVTERLILRPFRVEDLSAFVAYRSNPAVARYQSWDATYSMADAERLFESQADEDFGKPGAWVQLAATDRLDGRLTGDCAVHFAEDQPATVEIGVTFAPAHQGQGLASEALSAVISRLFQEHAVHRIYARADDRNHAVHRLLDRMGFRCEARLIDADWFQGEWSTLRLFAILRDEWSSAQTPMGAHARPPDD